MRERPKFVINSISFYTKTRLTRYIRRILHSYEIGENVSKEHFNFLYDLIKKEHRWSERKIGCGILRFRVVVNPIWKKKCFYIIRTDGSSTDFSFMECINRPKDWVRADFEAACRTSVASQIKDFKDRFFGSGEVFYCPSTNERLTKENIHIHHEEPKTFQCIVKDWLKKKGLKMDEIQIGGYSDGENEKYFIDGSLERDFARYHLEKAKLRVIHKKAHLSSKRKNI